MTAPSEKCPVCRSDEAIRQTHATVRAQAWACDRCDSKWAFSVVNPRPFLDCIATAVSSRTIAAELLALAEQQLAQRRAGRPDADTDP